MQILIKSLIFRTLQIYIFSFYAFLFFVSLADGKLLDATHVEFLGCNFECVPVEGIAFDTNVKVEVDFEKVILQDNEEDGTLTGEVKFILYKGDHYHLTVLSDWDENVFVDTNDVWDDGDRVGITIPPDAIRIVKITD